MSNDGYLTMARIMTKEWEEFQRKAVWGKSYTGFEEIAIQTAFKDGFMKGFQARFFNTEEL